jgi:hypothetical protein
MAEARDLLNPVAACRPLAGMPMLRRNAFGVGLRKSHSALNQRELAQSYRSAKRQE